eukprot:CAMPEP_0194289156 /NCGR_PEP_ID=MMETSP0169-20130528/38471_1 /TAXON_ID=218684 /ORGANISM="Corethron pennatum, Strain L29A3" /LENGTH=206 /DNA_ID=CAMNT_0039036365 /DNA_START=36 /DNA_END=653 /DNA_ORIENTATION=+
MIKNEDPSDLVPSWECQGCTFENSMSSSECIVCKKTNVYSGNYKGATFDTDENAKPGGQSRVWHCQQCTLENEIDASQCVVCGATNSSHGRQQQHTSDLPPDLPSSNFVAPSHTSHASEQTSTEEVVPETKQSKSKGRCGACGGEGHNRRSATATNCTAYFEPAEVERRQKNQQAVRERAVHTQRELAEARMRAAAMERRQEEQEA